MEKSITMVKGSHRIQVAASRRKFYEGHGYKITEQPKMKEQWPQR